MTTAVVRASKELKSSTSNVRQHLDAVERAREIYLAGMKRLEADYYDRITKATAIVSGNATTPDTPAHQPQEAAPIGAA